MNSLPPVSTSRKLIFALDIPEINSNFFNPNLVQNSLTTPELAQSLKNLLINTPTNTLKLIKIAGPLIDFFFLILIITTWSLYSMPTSETHYSKLLLFTGLIPLISLRIIMYCGSYATESCFIERMRANIEKENSRLRTRDLSWALNERTNTRYLALTFHAVAEKMEMPVALRFEYNPHYEQFETRDYETEQTDDLVEKAEIDKFLEQNVGNLIKQENKAVMNAWVAAIIIFLIPLFHRIIIEDLTNEVHLMMLAPFQIIYLYQIMVLYCISPFEFYSAEFMKLVNKKFLERELYFDFHRKGRYADLWLYYRLFGMDGQQTDQLISTRGNRQKKEFDMEAQKLTKASSPTKKKKGSRGGSISQGKKKKKRQEKYIELDEEQ